MNSRRFLVTCLLVVVLTLCLAAAALAAPENPLQQGAPSPETALQAEQAISCPDNKDNKSEQEVPGTIQAVDCSLVEIGQAVFAGGGSLQEAAPAGGEPVLGLESVTPSAEEQQMFNLVNRERSSAGAGQLRMDPSLAKLARLKAQDMVDKHYFDHNSPTYGSPFDMMKRFGISYSYAGENLAMAPSASSAHDALMNSPGHRANILNVNFDRVGIGIVVSGGYRYCVQMFTGGQRDTVPPSTSPGGSGGSVQQPRPETGTPPQPGQTPGDQAGISSDEALMVQLINQERASAGLPRLVADEQLFRVARLKARDFVENNYFGHTSPTYGSFKDMLNRFGLKYTSAGENLALSSSAARAHASLMASPGNKANILGAKYQRVGIGVAVKGSYKYFVEIYTGTGSVQPPSGGGAQPPGGGTSPPPGSGSDPGQPGTSDPGAAGLTADEQKMLNLVNSERSRYGLSPLKANLKLTGVARLKARDMIDKNYFNHTSPTYGSPFDMMRQFGISYRTAGENLAGAPTVDSAHTNLMNSPGHRANILNGSFKEVGIGILSGSPYGKIFVQMFTG